MPFSGFQGLLPSTLSTLTPPFPLLTRPRFSQARRKRGRLKVASFLQAGILAPLLIALGKLLNSSGLTFLMCKRGQRAVRRRECENTGRADAGYRRALRKRPLALQVHLCLPSAQGCRALRPGLPCLAPFTCGTASSPRQGLAPCHIPLLGSPFCPHLIKLFPHSLPY